MKKYFALFILISLISCGCRSSILDDPSTIIDYSIPQKSIVTLTIENSYNTVIATPVDHVVFDAGSRMVTVDGSKWLSGVYYYTIEYKGVNSNYYYKTTKKMLLIK